MITSTKAMLSIGALLFGILTSTLSQANQDHPSQAALTPDQFPTAVEKEDQCLSQEDISSCLKEDTLATKVFDCDAIWNGKKACECSGPISLDCRDMYISGACKDGTFRCGTAGCICEAT